MKKKIIIRRIAIIMLVLVFSILSACGDDKGSKEKEKKTSGKTEQSADEENSKNDSKKKKTKKSSSVKKTEKSEESAEDESGSRADKLLKNKVSDKNKDDNGQDETSNETAGASFIGDWEGMTLLTDSKGETKKGRYRISDDYIIGTYARVKLDDDGNMQMDMVGITIPELNFSVDSCVYDPASDTVAVSGKMGGGTYDTVLQAPDGSGVLTLSGRTNGDIKSNYVVYMKRLDSEWDRSDAPLIGDKEYNIYIGNNVKENKGRTLEERVAAYKETGFDVDMSDFLK